MHEKWDLLGKYLYQVVIANDDHRKPWEHRVVAYAGKVIRVTRDESGFSYKVKVSNSGNANNSTWMEHTNAMIDGVRLGEGWHLTLEDAIDHIMDMMGRQCNKLKKMPPIEE